LLVACSAPAAPRVTVPAPAAAPEPDPAPRAQAPHPLDTSIATIWGYDPNKPEYKPYVAPAPEEREHTASPAPRPRKQGPKRAPCFANRDVLVASEVFKDLERYTVYMGDAGDTTYPPPARYGTCTIKDGKVTDARGTLVAEIHCGLTVYATGIIDDLGFEIGALGSDVAKAREEPNGEVFCWDDGDGHARCWFQNESGDETVHYGFGTKIDTRAGENGPLRGADARLLFETFTVSRFTQRIYCH
jgi:hypothetical protein